MHKTIAIMQPYFLPYIGYFQLINAVDVFICYDDVNYINRGWINRNNILVNREPHLFTIPLKDASQNRLINEIDISNELKWEVKLLKTIEMSYKNAPYFKNVFPIVVNVLKYEERNLSEFIFNSLLHITEYLSIKTKIIRSSTIYNNRNLTSQLRILDICKQESADQYINPSGGVSIYSRELFVENGIELHFLEAEKVQYKQYDDEFIPWLSILDVLMFNAPHQITALLKCYALF